MKPIQNFLFCSLFTLFIIVASLSAYGQAAASDQEKKQIDNPRSAVEKKSFVFVARSASPSGRGIRYLTGTYILKVDSAAVESDLPYFGRVYQATYGGDAGLNFTSKEFEYKWEPRKKGGWTVHIATKDLSSDFKLQFTIFEDGHATLQVSGADRQPISYDGEIKVDQN